MGDKDWLFDNECAPRVLVCGDLMLDMYFSGDVTRISPEAPIPVLRRRAIVQVPGGAANVAANLATLGARVSVCGVVGNDEAGQVLQGLLKDYGLEDVLIVTDPDRPTTVKIRLVSAHQQIARVDIEEPRDLPVPLGEGLIEMCARALTGRGRVDALVLSDYSKGVFTASTAARLMRLAREAGVFSVVNPKGHDVSRYRGANVLVRNRKEASLVVGFELRSREDLDSAGLRLLELADPEMVVITLGKEGTYYRARAGPSAVVASTAREVFDVTGAGDTLVSAFTLAQLATGSLDEAVKIGNVAAGIVVGEFGTSTVTRSEIAVALARNHSPEGKTFMKRDELVPRLRQLREAGKKIVFTNGCFDLLHVGHLSLLTSARSFGDLLIVGVNSDNSVRRNKGGNRPLNRERDRMLLLAALECVDLVTGFEEDSPLELIKLVRPDVLVKGADYGLDQVCGRELIEGYGGEVKTVALVPGVSTSALLSKVKHDRAFSGRDAAGRGHRRPFPR